MATSIGRRQCLLLDYCRVTVNEPRPPVLLTKDAVIVLLLRVAVPVKLSTSRLKDRFRDDPDIVPEVVPTPESVKISAHVPTSRV